MCKANLYINNVLHKMYSHVLFLSYLTALIAIGRYSMTIETVDVGWCKEITDWGAIQIAQSSKSLRYLGLMRCDKVRSFYIKDCFL